MAQEGVGGAAANYFEKVVQVEGVTVPPPRDKFPTAAVKFALAGVPRPKSTARCDVVGVPAPGEEEKVKALSPGRKVRVVGYVIAVGNDVIGMHNCTVTDLGPGPEPTPVRAAADVTAEFARDEAAARARYGLTDGVPAVLLLEGTVTESARAGDTGTFQLAGAGGASVRVTIRVDEYVRPPEVGQTVTAGGLFDGYDTASRTLKLSVGSAIP
jgi:hypothetical protein